MCADEDEADDDDEAAEAEWRENPAFAPLLLELELPSGDCEGVAETAGACAGSGSITFSSLRAISSQKPLVVVQSAIMIR